MGKNLCEILKEILDGLHRDKLGDVCPISVEEVCCCCWLLLLLLLLLVVVGCCCCWLLLGKNLCEILKETLGGLHQDKVDDVCPISVEEVCCRRGVLFGVVCFVVYQLLFFLPKTKTKNQKPNKTKNKNNNNNNKQQQTTTNNNKQQQQQKKGTKTSSSRSLRKKTFPRPHRCCHKTLG